MANCPEITITVVHIGEQCENGKRKVKFKAVLTGIEGPLEYEWDFGDGTDSQYNSVSGISGEWNTTITTVHWYEPPAGLEEYTVIFRQTNKPDCPVAQINIKPDPCGGEDCPNLSVSVTSISTECFDDDRYRKVSLDATFSNITSPVVAYWSFGDGEDSNSPPVTILNNNGTFPITHKYEVPGPYIATLRLVGNCPSSSIDVGPLEPCVVTAPTDDPIAVLHPSAEPERRPPVGTGGSGGSFSCSFFEMILVASLLATLLLLFASCVPWALYATLVTLLVFIVSLTAWLVMCRPSACRVWQRIYWALTWAIIIGGFIAATVCPYLFPLLGVYAVIRELVAMVINSIPGCTVPSGFSWPFCIKIPTSKR